MKGKTCRFCSYGSPRVAVVVLENHTWDSKSNICEKCLQDFMEGKLNYCLHCSRVDFFVRNSCVSCRLLGRLYVVTRKEKKESKRWVHPIYRFYSKKRKKPEEGVRACF